MAVSYDYRGLSPITVEGSGGGAEHGLRYNVSTVAHLHILRLPILPIFSVSCPNFLAPRLYTLPQTAGQSLR